ncbi:MAG TPA: hypothetical protein VK306_03095 [Acidimicrobiales bacterium]|nr:hypothetical protein [Acidimicrobiales bacterium]
MADDESNVTVADVLGALTTEPLTEGDRPLSAWMMVKSIDAGGDAVWAVREAGDPIAPEELLGSLTAYTEYLKGTLAADWGD